MMQKGTEQAIRIRANTNAARLLGEQTKQSYVNQAGLFEKMGRYDESRAVWNAARGHFGDPYVDGKIAALNEAEKWSRYSAADEGSIDSLLSEVRAGEGPSGDFSPVNRRSLIAKLEQRRRSFRSMQYRDVIEKLDGKEVPEMVAKDIIGTFAPNLTPSQQSRMLKDYMEQRPLSGQEYEDAHGAIMELILSFDPEAAPKNYVDAFNATTTEIGGAMLRDKGIRGMMDEAAHENMVRAHNTSMKDFREAEEKFGKEYRDWRNYKIPRYINSMMEKLDRNAPKAWKEGRGAFINDVQNAFDEYMGPLDSDRLSNADLLGADGFVEEYLQGLDIEEVLLRSNQAEAERLSSPSKVIPGATISEEERTQGLFGPTSYFSDEELGGLENMHRPTLFALNSLREEWGEPLIANSGHRTPERNRKVGGAPSSQHLHGKAIDINTRGWDASKKQKFVHMAKKHGFTSFGGYKNTIHIDTRKGRSHWGHDHTPNTTPAWLREIM